MELIWNLSKKYWGECTLSSKISSLHQHRFGSGGMSFSVRRVSYHKSVYTGNSIASAAKNILQNILFEYSTKTHKKKIPAWLLKPVLALSLGQITSYLSRDRSFGLQQLLRLQPQTSAQDPPGDYATIGESRAFIRGPGMFSAFCEIFVLLARNF